MSRQPSIAAPPHIRAPLGTPAIMWWVSATLLPVVAAATWFFGLHALLVVLLCTLSAAGTEALWRLLRKEPQTEGDGSAALTGLLLALTLPPMVPWWIAVVGGSVSILLGKMVFGGLGWNIFNPALVGRAFLMLSWVRHLSKDWAQPMAVIDAKTSATPLYAMELLQVGEPVERFVKADAVGAFLWGNVSGCIGEVSALLLLLGGLVLLAKGIIDWRIPATYLGTVFLLTWILGRDPVFYLLAGGLLLGAFYMATDYVTSCITPRGRIVFGVGCGALTVMLRFYSGLPESVMFAILFMNMCAPLIDRYTVPRKFGWVRPS
ncbi:RnfABCDGE type electron transport complex subunit D [bacterium]|nr:MAG: RnfABCDGE type electron transport complex subunit D [bacterium]